MADEPSLLDPFAAAQMQAVQTIAQQIISAGRPPGGHIRDSLSLLERVVAHVVAKSGGASDDEATLHDVLAGARERIASMRNPA